MPDAVTPDPTHSVKYIQIPRWWAIGIGLVYLCLGMCAGYIYLGTLSYHLDFMRRYEIAAARQQQLEQAKEAVEKLGTIQIPDALKPLFEPLVKFGGSIKGLVAIEQFAQDSDKYMKARDAARAKINPPGAKGDAKIEPTKDQEYREFVKLFDPALANGFVASIVVQMSLPRLALLTYSLLLIAIGLTAGALRILNRCQPEFVASTDANVVLFPILGLIAGTFVLVLLSGFGTILAGQMDDAVRKFLVILALAAGVAPDLLLKALHTFGAGIADEVLRGAEKSARKA